jgi:transmembrane sensor
VETISELAARWAVRANAGKLRPDEQRELDSWLAADSRHLGAYVRARAQWVDLDRLAALHGPARGQRRSPVDSQEEEPDCDPAGGRAGIGSHSEITPSILSRRRLLAAAIAGVGVLGAGLSWTIFGNDRERYSSGIGEVRRIALADGSTLLLNTNSEVTVRLTKQRRDVRLFRGEALFEVTHDESRPFVVQANDTGVRAVGTAFAVRLENARVDVTVTEGVVEVADLGTMSGFDQGLPATSRAGVKRVAAHERAIIAPARPPDVEPVAPAEADRRLAWREGMVSFDGELLQTAVSEINRHNRRQIVVDDPSLASMPVVGVFRATDLDGFAAAAAAALDARATADGDIIRLRHRSLKN